MNSVKVEKNKLIFGLSSVGSVIFLMLPVDLSAHHFRYGTMSWSPTGSSRQIILKMQNGWTANHSSYREQGDYDPWVSGYIGSVSKTKYRINWGDNTANNSNPQVEFKIIQRDNVTVNYNCESNNNNNRLCIASTLSEMGTYDSGWTLGRTHTYSSDDDYVVSWTSSSRATVKNDCNNCGTWRNETKINIGGPYAGNSSPVSAVPPIVQVQDNTSFNYQLVATDANGDNLNYRWGYKREFFVANGSGDNTVFAMPTGMTLSTVNNKGLITWDIRDSVLADNAGGVNGDLWVAVIMVEDLHDNGSVKSYVPVDFFFKIREASNPPPEFIDFPSTTQTAIIGSTKTITFKSTDDSGIAPTFTVLNPPSDNISIWNTSTSTSGGTTTFSISFAPVSSMDNATYAINIRSTDNASMTKDQSFGLKVSSVSNADPTAPTLVYPTNGATVAKPVSFQWTNSTDADNDTVSYEFYLCPSQDFVGSGLCVGLSVAAGVKLMPPFNQNLQDDLISWPRYLDAAPIYQQVSQDLSMIPKWLIMLTAFGMLSILISFSLKNISNRKLVIILILLILFFSLNINSCSRSDDSTSEATSTSDESSTTTDNSTSSSGDTSTTATSVTINDIAYTTSDVTNNTTYYWKVVASDPNGGSAESATWSFTVQ